MRIQNNRLFIFLILCLPFQVTYSQEPVKTSGTAQLELTKDKSRLDIENQLRELATIDALEKAFGRVIIQGNATYITNIQSGEKSQTNTVFNTIANTSVKGEVVKVIDERFTDIEGQKSVDGHKVKYIEIRCDIILLAREIITTSIDFNSFPLNCPYEKCKTTLFKNHDDLYLFFSSPISGFLTIYLDGNNQAQCLFPYSTMGSEYESGVPVSADVTYILFSKEPEHNYISGKYFVPDTYELYTDNLQEMNRVFIIFSRNPLNKPHLNPVRELENGYKLPKSLPSEDFQAWLNKFRSLERSNIQVEIIDIVIRK